jgi:DNA-directed RNA polymerase specialized sigma24 family protein
MNVQSESSSRGSITQWIEELRNHDSDATRKIWNRFVERLVRVANRKLRNSNCRITDGEMVAADAFHDFFERSPAEFAKLVNRNDLWQILVVITERRAIDAIRKESSQRRGGGKIIQEVAFGGVVEGRLEGVSSLVGPANPPDIELMLIEAFDERLASLDSDLMRQIAIDKMHGMKNIEIAESRSISLRSVERKLAMIRRTWRGN